MCSGKAEIADASSLGEGKSCHTTAQHYEVVWGNSHFGEQNWGKVEIAGSSLGKGCRSKLRFLLHGSAYAIEHSGRGNFGIEKWGDAETAYF